ARDLAAECKGYDDLLTNLSRDVQLLGLGSNGHIAFNEPGSPFDSRTRVVQLYESTVNDNSRLFARPEDVPTHAITMGIADIMSSKRILLLASGVNKAQAVRDMVRGEVTVDCPASILQRHHDVTVILDKQAASLL
ncbi:MAG: glucosamine-6-phosphate deaminase, partial [Clostridiales bacterium]|nr:glucosamine-6-phosphate deaminase [Clostridiales bacterium]